jgi:hypothetical protein
MFKIIVTLINGNEKGRQKMRLKKSHIMVFCILLGVCLLFLYSCKGKEVASSDLKKDADFESWSLGDNKNPDGWILGGAATGTVNKDTSVVKEGKSSAKVTMISGEALALYQDIENFDKYKNKEFVFSCWVKADGPDSAILALHDGVKWFNSTMHSGSGQWEQLTVKGKISRDASKIRAHLWVKNNAVVFFDAASLRIE